MAEKISALIPDHFNHSFFQNALEFGLRLTDIEIIKWDIMQSLAGGENYCSIIYRAHLLYQVQNRENIEEIFLVIKYLPKEKQGLPCDLQIFRRETIFYLDIKTKLETLMWQVVGKGEDNCEKENWQLGARHIFSSARPEQVIILEDLCPKGFKLRERQKGLDENDAIIVLKKLAQYHACSMVMTQKDSNMIKKIYQCGLLNQSSINSPSFKALFGSQLLKLASIITEWPGYEKISLKLYKYYDKFAEIIMNSVYPLTGSINVLNHGDLWINNLLFKDTGNDEAKEKEVRFIDFQLSFYGSPGFDLNYFFNTSLQKNVLENSKHTLLEIYYRVLTETLLKLNPQNITPPTFDLIKKEFEERENYGFFVAFGFLPLMAMTGIDSCDNSLEKFHDSSFAAKKIELMFEKNGRAVETLKYILQYLDKKNFFEQIIN